MLWLEEFDICQSQTWKKKESAIVRFSQRGMYGGDGGSDTAYLFNGNHWKRAERLLKIPLQKGLQSNALICTLSAKLYTGYFYVQ